MKEIFMYKDFTRLYIANTISRFGDSVDMIAYSYLVYLLTGSEVLLATVFIFNVLPNIIFSTFAGTVVDFFSKKNIVILGDLLRASLVLLAAVLHLNNLLLTWHLFSLTFLNSTIETFVSPCKFSTIPKLIDEKHYLLVNSSLRSITNLVELIGLASAGIIIGFIGVSGALILDAITFLISSMIISLVKFPHEKKIALTKSNYSSAYKEGIKFTFNNKVILALVISMALLNFLLTPMNALLPAYVKDILLMGPEGISYFSISFAIGGIFGGIIAGKIGEKLSLKRMIAIGLLLGGVSYTCLGLPIFIPLLNNILIICIFALLLGLFIPFASAGLSTFLMKIIPKDMLARVGAVMNMFGQCATPLGALASAIIVAFFPLSGVILISGMLFIFTTIIPVKALSKYKPIYVDNNDLIEVI